MIMFNYLERAVKKEVGGANSPFLWVKTVHQSCAIRRELEA